MKRKYRLKKYREEYIIQERLFLLWSTVKDEHGLLFIVPTIEEGREAVKMMIDARTESEETKKNIRNGEVIKL